MSLRSRCDALARRGVSAIVALAAASGAHAAFTGVSAEITLITFNGSPHAIVDVYANFSQANDNLLNVFQWQGAFTPSSALKHLDFFNGTWNPTLGLPFGSPNPTDSSVRIGGAFDFVNATMADPAWGSAGFNQFFIPAQAGWFTSNPQILQGQAGPDLKTPFARVLIALVPGATVKVKGAVGYNAGPGTPTQFGEFDATFDPTEIPVPPGLNLSLPFDGTLNGEQGEMPTQATNTSFVPGVFGQAASLAFGAQLFYPSAETISAREGTAEFWVKPTWPGSDTQNRFFLLYGPGGGGMILYKDTTFLRAIFNRFSVNGLPEVDVIFNVADWPAQEWRHVAYTWSDQAKQLKIYVDGKLRSTKEFTSTLPGVSSPSIQIGGDGNGGWIEAAFDNLRIHGSALPAEAILASYAAGLESIAIAPDALESPATVTRRFRALAVDPNGDEVDATAAASWSVVSGPASIIAPGVVFPSAPGTSVIRATFAGAQSDAELIAGPVPTDPPFTLVSAKLGGGVSLENPGDALGFPMVSGNGRFVAFSSAADDMADIIDFNGKSDVFVRDLATQTTRCVSEASDGFDFVTGNNASIAPDISDDGRWVVFLSDATDLLAQQAPINSNVHLDDAQGSLREVGFEAAAPAGTNRFVANQVGVSGDGRFVVAAGEFRAGDTLLLRGLYRWNRETNAVDVVEAPLTAGFPLTFRGISQNGRYVVFASSNDYTGAGTAGVFNIYRKDMTTGTVALVSSFNGQPAAANCDVATVSADGRVVVFRSFASNLSDPAPQAPNLHVYVRDMLEDECLWISAAEGGVDPNGTVGSLAVSGNGRFAAFRSSATNLFADDVNGASDLFRVDLLTGDREVVTTAPWGQAEGETAFGASLSADGSVLAFGTEAGNLALGDINLRRDVLVRTYEVAIPGDLDGDGIVGAADLAILLGSWGAAGGAADLDGDGSVGASDLALLLGAWSVAP